MVRSLRYRLCLLALVGGLTFSAGWVFAGALPVPVNITPVASTPAGLQSVVTFDARGVGGAANAGYYSRPVLVSNNTLSGLANGLARRALPVAAFVGAVAAAGWAIDELTKQVMSAPAEEDRFVQPGAYYYIDSTVGHTHASAAASAQFMCSLASYPCAVDAALVDCGGPGGNQCYARLRNTSNNETYIYGNNRGVNPYSYPYEVTSPLVQPHVIGSPQLADFIKNNPQLWNDALRNPDGSVNRNPDVQGEAQRLADELLDPEAVPQPDPTAEWDTGLQGGDPQNSPTALEFPVFCTWASKVCELADWLMADDDEEPPANEIDWIDPQAAVTWSSGLGGGSCPADVSASLPFGGEVTFPMGQFCEAADMIRPLVLVSAALIAAMIIGGYRRAP